MPGISSGRTANQIQTDTNNVNATAKEKKSKLNPPHLFAGPTRNPEIGTNALQKAIDESKGNPSRHQLLTALKKNTDEANELLKKIATLETQMTDQASSKQHAEEHRNLLLQLQNKTKIISNTARDSQQILLTINNEEMQAFWAKMRALDELMRNLKNGVIPKKGVNPLLFQESTIPSALENKSKNYSTTLLQVFTGGVVSYHKETGEDGKPKFVPDKPLTDKNGVAVEPTMEDLQVVARELGLKPPTDTWTNWFANKLTFGLVSSKCNLECNDEETKGKARQRLAELQNERFYGKASVADGAAKNEAGTLVRGPAAPQPEEAMTLQRGG